MKPHPSYRRPHTVLVTKEEYTIMLLAGEITFSGGVPCRLDWKKWIKIEDTNDES